MTTLSMRLAGGIVLIGLSVMPVPAESQAPAPPTCLAVVLPSVEGVEGSASDVASAIRDLFVSYLTGPVLNPMPLQARLPAQAALEARQKGCGQMLIVSMVRKRSGGGKVGSVLGQAAGTAAWSMPYGLGAGAAVARTAAIAGAQAASGLASDTRKKDEIRVSYRVGTPESVAQVSPVMATAKARVDNEDLLTPLVERAAQDIFSKATAR